MPEGGRSLGSGDLPSGDFKVNGTLSIHGGKHPLSVQLQRTGSGNAVRFQGQFEVPYIDWGMKDPSKTFLKVAKTVLIELDLGVGLSPQAPLSDSRSDSPVTGSTSSSAL